MARVPSWLIHKQTSVVEHAVITDVVFAKSSRHISTSHHCQYATGFCPTAQDSLNPAAVTLNQNQNDHRPILHCNSLS